MAAISRSLKLGSISLAIAALLVGGWWFWLRDQSPTADYRLETVCRATLEVKVVANGTINPVTTVLVGTQVTGMIKEILVDFNSEVKTGQVIARIDPSLYKARVDQARGRYRQAQANVSKAQANLEDAQNDYRRYQNLWKLNLVARDDFDNAYTRYIAALSELQAARAQVAEAAATLKSAETDLKYTTIVSPVDGVVVSRNADVGQTVVSSFQPPTLFNIAQDLTKMQVNTTVDEADIGKVCEGQSASFTVDAYPGRTFTGVVSQVRLAPQTRENVVTYNVIIQTDNLELLLKPGMTANVTIKVIRREDVLVVSNAALRYRPPHQKPGHPPSGSQVWISGPHRQPVPVPIETGITEGRWTEVIRGDLQAGDKVIVSRGSGTKTPYQVSRRKTSMSRPF